MNRNAYVFITASQKVLADKVFLIGFLVLSFIVFWILLYIPVRTTPGNDLAFQLSLLTSKDYMLLITLSVLTALSLVMNIYLFREQYDAKARLATVSQGSAGSVFAGLVGSLFGTASCGYCVASLFGFLGAGSIMFLLQYRHIVTITAIALLVVSLYFTAQKVLGICNVCRVDYKRKR